MKEQVQKDDFFLRQVETTVQRVLDAHGYDPVLISTDRFRTTGTRSRNKGDNKDDVSLLLELPPDYREELVVARALDGRIRAARTGGVCPRCWLKCGFCFCSRCPPVEIEQDEQRTASIAKSWGGRNESNLNRIFLVMHHQEILMGVDTAKLILACFPLSGRLVVAGIGSQHQDSMAEMEEAMEKRRDRCLVLFPDDCARTFDEIEKGRRTTLQKGNGSVSFLGQNGGNKYNEDGDGVGWDVIVIDGTWQQARRIKKRYFPSSDTEGGGLQTAKLSAIGVAELEREEVDTATGMTKNCGHQLRKHSIAWKKVGTFEACRLFLADLMTKDYTHTYCEEKYNEGTIHRPNADVVKGGKDAPWVRIKDYQRIANVAANAQNHFKAAGLPK